jgi:hypothetical protein
MFWDFFESLGTRTDDLGELARRVATDPDRNYRRLSVLTCFDFIRQQYNGEMVDDDLAVFQQAVALYAESKKPQPLRCPHCGELVGG